MPYGSPLTADTSPVNDVEFSPDGRTLASGHGRSAVVWNMNGEQAIGKPLGGPTDLMADVSFSPDGSGSPWGGSTAARSCTTPRRDDRRSGSSRLGRLRSRLPPRRESARRRNDRREGAALRPTSGAAAGSLLDGGSSAVWQIAFSPDGRLLAVAVDPNGVDGFYGQQREGEVQLWDVDSRTRVGQAIAPGGGSVLSLAFNRDGTLLATGSYRGQLDLWDVATRARRGEPMRVVDDGILSVTFDPSGRLVAGGGATGPVRVWRVADQQPAFPPLTGPHRPRSPGSPSTRPARCSRPRACSAGPGCGTRPRVSATATSWSEARSPTRSCRRSTFRFWGCGTRSARTASCWPLPESRRAAMLWDVDPAVWRERACAIVGRNLSREEWELYLPPGTPYRATCSEWPTG